MNRLALLLTLMICAVGSLYPQRAGDRQAMSEQDREKWLTEMRNFKHEFLTRELSLSKEQQDAFFPVYDAMDDELNQVTQETRDLEAKVTNNADATDAEVEAVARALFAQKSREGEIEVTYFEKFKETLTPKQLLRLKNAERKFTQQLVKHHGRTKADVQRRKQ